MGPKKDASKGDDNEAKPYMAWSPEYKRRRCVAGATCPKRMLMQIEQIPLPMPKVTAPTTMGAKLVPKRGAKPNNKAPRPISEREQYIAFLAPNKLSHQGAKILVSSAAKEDGAKSKEPVCELMAK